MSELQKRAAALKAKKEAEAAEASKAAAKASAQPSTENAGTAKPEIPGRTSPTVAAKVEDKPKKEAKPKVECEFCGSEFSEASIKKHEKSCKENPENKVETLTREQVEAIIAPFEAKIKGEFAAIDKAMFSAKRESEDRFDKLVKDLTASKEALASLKGKLESGNAVNSALLEDVKSLADEWNALRAPVLKRWKQCPGYLKLVQIFDAKLQRVIGSVVKT